MNILESIKNFFSVKKILTKFDHSAIGIDIGSSSIKIIELEKIKGRAVLKTYGELALGPYAGTTIGQIVNLSNSKLGEALKDILKESKVMTNNSGMAIPFKSSLVSLIEMPNVGDKKLTEMIPIEARKYIPVPISEVTLDWWILPKEKDYISKLAKDGTVTPVKDKTDVLVVSIHNEILNDYNNLVKNNNLNTSFFEIEMFSTTRSVVAEGSQSSMVFDFGASSTKLYVVERGIIRNSHIINKGSQDITRNIATGLSISFEEAEKVKCRLGELSTEDRKVAMEVINLSTDYIFAEANNFITNFEKKYGEKIKHIILTGGGAMLFDLPKMMKEKFGADISLGDPFSKVEIPAFLKNTLSKNGLGFAVATGIALRKLQEIN